MCVCVSLTLGPCPVCQPARPFKVLQDRLTPSNMFKHGHGGAQDRSGDGGGGGGGLQLGVCVHTETSVLKA